MGPKKELDYMDKKILYELDNNSRQTISSIAKKVNISRERASYRIKRLKESGTIRSFTALTNPSKLGFSIYKTYLKLENNKKKIKKFLEELKLNQRVYWIAKCDGNWDLLFSLFARSPKEFYTLQREIVSKYSDIIMSLSVYTLVDVWHYPRNYLLKGKRAKEFYFGGSTNIPKIDSIDINILHSLTKNSRENVVDIARDINSTAMVVKHRIKKLEKNGVITGYRIGLNLKDVKVMFFKVQIFLREYDLDQEIKLQEFCRQNPNIMYFIRQIGDCTLEIELEVESYLEFTKIVGKIKEEFSKIIKHISPTLIKKEFFRWVPKMD